MNYQKTLGSNEGLSDAWQSHDTKPAQTVQAGGDPVQVIGPRSSCSIQDLQNIIIELKSTRTTESTETTHKDHIADHGRVSMSHYNMGHKPVPISKEMKKS